MFFEKQGLRFKAIRRSILALTAPVHSLNVLDMVDVVRRVAVLAARVKRQLDSGLSKLASSKDCYNPHCRSACTCCLGIVAIAYTGFILCYGKPDWSVV